MVHGTFISLSKPPKLGLFFLFSSAFDIMCCVGGKHGLELPMRDLVVEYIVFHQGGIEGNNLQDVDK